MTGPDSSKRILPTSTLGGFTMSKNLNYQNDLSNNYVKRDDMVWFSICVKRKYCSIQGPALKWLWWQNTDYLSIGICSFLVAWTSPSISQKDGNQTSKGKSAPCWHGFQSSQCFLSLLAPTDDYITRKKLFEHGNQRYNYCILSIEMLHCINFNTFVN